MTSTPNNRSPGGVQLGADEALAHGRHVRQQGARFLYGGEKLRQAVRNPMKRET